MQTRFVRTLEQRAARKRNHKVSTSQHMGSLPATGRVARFKIKRALILCRRNENGIAHVKRKAMIKDTYLHREAMSMTHLHYMASLPSLHLYMILLYVMAYLDTHDGGGGHHYL